MKKIILSLIFAALCTNSAVCFKEDDAKDFFDEEDRTTQPNIFSDTENYPDYPTSSLNKTIEKSLKKFCEKMYAKRVGSTKDTVVLKIFCPYKDMYETQRSLKDIKKIMLKEHYGPFVIVMSFMDFRALLKLKKASKYFYEIFWKYINIKDDNKLSIKITRLDKFLTKFLKQNGHELIVFISDNLKTSVYDIYEDVGYLNLINLLVEEDKAENINYVALIKPYVKIDGMQALKRSDFLLLCKKSICEPMLQDKNPQPKMLASKGLYYGYYMYHGNKDRGKRSRS
jgi:hypothetical protein